MAAFLLVAPAYAVDNTKVGSPQKAPAEVSDVIKALDHTQVMLSKEHNKLVDVISKLGDEKTTEVFQQPVVSSADNQNIICADIALDILLTEEALAEEIELLKSSLVHGK